MGPEPSLTLSARSPGWAGLSVVMQSDDTAQDDRQGWHGSVAHSGYGCISRRMTEDTLGMSYGAGRGCYARIT
jgi:hypothetical protein